MGVSKNNGTPKWMVKIRENQIKMDDLGGPPLFLETSMCFFLFCLTPTLVCDFYKWDSHSYWAVSSWTKVMILDFPDVADSKALEKLYSDCTEYVSRKGG